MSEWTDHEAEAQDWIAAATRYPGATGSAVLAMAEATLALVDQARISNMIALGHLQIASGLDGTDDLVGDGSAFRALYPDGPNTPLAPDIARALRIGDRNA